MVMHRFAGKQLTIPCVNDGKMHANAKTKLLSEIIGEEKVRQLIMQLGPRTLTIPNFRIFVNLRLMEGELPEVGVNMERSVAILQNE